MEIAEKRVPFSGPESSVDMEVMRGIDGKPVKVLNLPNPAYQDYTQYRSVVLQHESTDHRFSYSSYESGTGGSIYGREDTSARRWARSMSRRSSSTLKTSGGTKTTERCCRGRQHLQALNQGDADESADLFMVTTVTGF
jgi:hypothetical protein